MRKLVVTAITGSMVVLGWTGAAGAHTANSSGKLTINSVSRPIIAAWWATNGELFVKLRSDAVALEVFYREKHPSSRREFAACKKLTDDTGPPETAIERATNTSSNLSTSLYSATKNIWSSLFDTTAHLDGAGNICAVASTPKRVHVSSKSRSELTVGLRRLSQVFDSLETAGIPSGVAATST